MYVKDSVHERLSVSLNLWLWIWIMLKTICTLPLIHCVMLIIFI
jgi:hypothetical protein